MAVASMMQRLLDNALTAKFAKSLKHSDLPEGWADNPEIVQLAEDAYSVMGTESPWFKAWFGNSKVVDEAGKPLDTFHGSRVDFSQFKNDLNFTSPSAEYASRYAQPDGMIYPLYTKAENPFDTRKPLPHAVFYNKFRPEYGASRLAEDTRLPDWTDAEDLKDFLGEKYSGRFDSLMITEPDPNGPGRISFAVFDPQQLKSKFNRGTFNPNDPNIYKGLIPAVGAGGLLALMGAEEAEAKPYQFPADKRGTVLYEPGLDSPIVDPADLLTAPIGVPTAALKAASVAAEPFISYGMDKAINGLLGLFSDEEE